MHLPEIPWESAYFWVALTFGVRLHTEVLVASVKKGAYFRGRLVSELYGMFIPAAGFINGWTWNIYFVPCLTFYLFYVKYSEFDG